MKRVLGAVAITGAVLAGMSGCFVGDDEERRDVSYAVAEPVRVLVVQGRIGGVVVRGGEGTGARVTEHQNYRGRRPAAATS
ncbi:hypothetical protein ACFQ0M_21480 [Kitasatospora aburaviensis]